MEKNQSKIEEIEDGYIHTITTTTYSDGSYNISHEYKFDLLIFSNQENIHTVQDLINELRSSKLFKDTTIPLANRLEELYNKKRKYIIWEFIKGILRVR